jgi:wyosine [tRNA(Phe)-imidazoG37] synthetase (radical SAM superfamily)
MKMREPTEKLFASHPRGFDNNRHVYPVLSRRAGGISIGVNLSLDQSCNFNCIYCQVRRGQTTGQDAVDLDLLADELDRTIELVRSGEIFLGPRFRDVPERLRRLNDIAFSGDGEPTASADFPQAVEICAAARRRHALDDVKLVLITNAGLLHLPRVRGALETLDANGGEIWAKLDAGTEECFRRVNRSTAPWRQILENLRETARVRPIVIQSLFMRINGQPPTETEIAAYCERLGEILSAGGRIKLVQAHTIARPPAEPCAAPLDEMELETIAAQIRRATGLTVATYPGSR